MKNETGKAMGHTFYNELEITQLSISLDEKPLPIMPQELLLPLTEIEYQNSLSSQFGVLKTIFKDVQVSYVAKGEEYTTLLFVHTTLSFSDIQLTNRRSNDSMLGYVDVLMLFRKDAYLCCVLMPMVSWG